MGAYAKNLQRRLRNPLPPAAVSMIREGAEAREKAILKGIFDGNCNVTRCQRVIKGENWFNTSTRAYYCGTCAREINRWSQRDEGKVICVEVTDPNDKPPFPR
ncbi:hypothetical protein [Methylobacterium sp. AMS5]|uniref:hypothetical protein n=1 Tax=Methylobacterium sp. AMS5 TaxID=925818 RepID=UPI00074FA053|nr:hypothetical protein [Methylobacterium sp. AMS5]AMB48311.1 hypothetical protein Y590_25420 [Methylobacterium sp. AMS5]